MAGKADRHCLGRIDWHDVADVIVAIINQARALILTGPDEMRARLAASAPPPWQRRIAVLALQ